jgi:hypothetical protein
MKILKPWMGLLLLLQAFAGKQLVAQAHDDWRSFTAQKQKNTVLLQWQTNAEYNSEDFLIQHSTNGFDWNTIGTIQAAGNSSSVRSYRFVHQEPVAGLNFYRVILMDENKRGMVSRILTVEFRESNLMLLYPNPVAGGTINLQLREQAEVLIYTRNGNVILQKHCPAGRSSITIGRLPAGLYQLKAGDEVQTFLVR